jgi:beta-xylosidase/AraC-like DNA-binding protein
MVDRELTEFSVDLHQVRYLAEPGGNSLTLIQLLHGELFLQSGDRFNSLREGAIALVNRHTDWILEGAGENAVMVITLTGQWIARWYPDFFLYDYQQTPQSDQERWNSALRNALHQVLLATVIKDEPRYRLELNRWLSELMLILIAGFQQPTQAHSSRHQHWSRRITQVVQRIEANVGRRISLGEIARAEFVSQAWLSKLFRREVGVSFMQFITALRLQNAVKALRSTSKPVHQIALEQGFANNRQMIDLFKRHYGKTPRQFRRAPHNAPPASVRDESTPKHSVHAVPSHLLFTLLRRTQNSVSPPAPLRFETSEEIRIAVQEAKARPQRGRNIIITLREIEDILQHDVQTQLRELRRTLSLNGLDIVEPILNSPLLANHWQPPLVINPNWTRFQRIISLVEELGLTLTLRLDAASSPERLRAFLHQCVNHFSTPLLMRWRFLWMWSPARTPSQNEQSWQALAQAVRTYLPDAPVGIGYDFGADISLIPYDPLWRQPLLHDADFIACAADANASLTPGNEGDDTPLQHAIDYPARKLRAITRELHRHGLTRPIRLLTWNTLTGQTRNTNGGFFRGALVMHSLLTLPDSVTCVGFWLNSTLQREALEGERVDTTSLAIWFGDTLPRPVYWVLRLWRRLTGERLALGPGYLLTRSNGGWRLLLSNTVAFNPDLCGQDAFIQRFRRRICLTITGVPPGRWRLRRLRFDQQNGALFPLLERMQSASGPDAEALEWVRHRARPQMRMWDEIFANDWVVEETLESNALVLYELTPLR